MRTAGIHLHQPLSPVTAANQQQRDGAIMWAEGSDGNDRLASRRNNSPDDSRWHTQELQVRKKSLQG